MGKINKPFGLGGLIDKNIKAAQASQAAKANAANETVINTFAVKMLGADFRIDHQPRRKNNTLYRRALVHDQNDGLTINWAKDYPGGVVINGDVKCPNTLEVGGQDILMLLKNMKLKIETLEQRLEELSWNSES